MGLYQRDNVTFVGPAGWSDAGITRLQPAPAAAGAPAPTISVERSPLRAGETLHLYYQRSLVVIGHQVGRVDMMAKEERKVGGSAAILLHIRFHTPAGFMEQMLAFVLAPGEPDPAAMVFSVTAVAGTMDQAKVPFLALLDTVRFVDAFEASSGPRSLAPALEASEGPLPPLVPMPGVRQR